MDHIQKLNKYQEKIRELHQLSQESGVKTDTTFFDHVDIQLSETTLITETWYNDDNKVSKVITFPLSAVEDFTNRIGEKIKYRRKIIEEKKTKEEGKDA
jgi:hypothetical protein